MAKKLVRRPLRREELSELKGTSVEGLAKRQIRKPILDAWDIYKGNVNYGAVIETPEEHAEVVSWYRDLCDLKDEAFTDSAIPVKVKKHLEAK